MRTARKLPIVPDSASAPPTASEKDPYSTAGRGEADGVASGCRADPMATNGQFSYPPANGFVAVYGQDPVATVTRLDWGSIETRGECGTVTISRLAGVVTRFRVYVQWDIGKFADTEMFVAFGGRERSSRRVGPLRPRRGRVRGGQPRASTPSSGRKNLLQQVSKDLSGASI